MRPGLRLVFIGANPGLESARAGHYYAFRGNVFWRQLYEAGIVDRPVSFADDAMLADEYGIGFTDLCARPTARAEELTEPELVTGAALLAERLAAFQPKVAVFSGRSVFRDFARLALAVKPSQLSGRPYGTQPERPGETELRVIPSSSGLASRWHGLRLELLRELAAALASRGMGW